MTMISQSPVSTIAIPGEQTSRSPRGSLGKDDFLKILVSQLQNQDPMKPMEDQDFIAQMAQFTALEQMQSLNEGFGLGQAFSLVGKTVSAQYTDAGGNRLTVYGLVTRALSRNGQACLEVGGIEIPYSQDIIIYAPEPGPQPPEAAAGPNQDN